MSELDLSLRLKADASGLVGTVRVSRQELDKLTKSTDKSGKGMKRFSGRTDRADKSARALNRSSKNLSRRLISLRGVLATLGVGLVARSFIQAASTSEQYRVRLKVLLGSVGEGNRLFKAMNTFANGTSFEFENVMGAATQLAGVMRSGVDEIKRWIPLIGDLAATSGLSIQQTSDQIVRMYSAGAGAADLFRDRGILSMLGFQAGVSVSAEETRKILMESWKKANSQFRGATRELAKTWVGRMSMLSDKWFEFRNQVMDAGLFDWLKSLVSIFDKGLGEAIDGSKSKAKAWSDSIISTIESVAIGTAGLVDVLAEPLRMIGALASNLWNGFKQLPAWAQQVGILGALFLGTKGRLAILGVLAATNQLDIRKFESVVTADQFVKGTEEELRAKLATVEQQIATHQEKLQRSWWDFRNALPDPTSFMPSLEALKGTKLQLRVALGEVGSAAQDLPNIPDALFGEGGSGNTTSAEATARAFFKKIRDGMTGVTDETESLGKQSKKTGGETKSLTKQQLSFIDSLKEERRLLKFMGKELEIQTALGRAHELGIKDQDAAIRDLVGSMYELEKAQEGTKASAEAMAQIYKDTASSIRQSFRDTFRDVLDNGIEGFKGFADRVKNLFKDMLADLATLAIARPIIVPVVSAVGGLLGVSQAAQAGVTQQLGGGGGLPNIPGLSSLLPGGGGVAKILDPFLAKIPGIGLDTAFLAKLGAGFAAGYIGNAAGNYAADKFGINTNDGGTIGGTIGGIGGFIIGGPIGAAIGSFLGNVAGNFVGDLLGFGKSKSKIQIGNAIDAENARGFNNQRETPFGIVGLTRRSNNFGGGLGRSITDMLSKIDEAIAAQLTAAQIEIVKQGITGGGLTEEVRIKAKSFDNEIFDVAKNRLTRIIDALAENDIASQLLNEVPRGEKNVDQLVGAAQEIIQLINLFSDDGAELNEAEQALRAINSQFEELAIVAAKLGFSVEDVVRKQNDAIAQLTTDFNQSIRNQILAIEDPLTLALENQAIIAERRLDNAKTLGAELVEVERLNALERQRVLEQFGQGALAAFNRDTFSALQNVQGFLESLSLSNLSPLLPQQRLDIAKQQFSSTLESARLGDLSAINALPGVGQQLLREGRDFFAGTAGFQELFRQVNLELSGIIQTQSDPLVSQLEKIGAQSVDNTQAIVDELRALRNEVTGLRRDNEALNDSLTRIQAGIAA